MNAIETYGLTKRYDIIFLLVVLSTVMLANTVANTTVFSAILSFGGYLILILSGYLPIVGSIMPGALLPSIMFVIIHGNQIVLFPQIVIAFALSMVFVCILTVVLRLQEL